jgi:hypothetical protein
VEQAHAIGLKAFAWEMLTMRSTPARAEKMKNMGVDVMIVNQPEVYLPLK